MSPESGSDQRSREILRAACTCLSERGYAATTISEIAAEAGVSRGLLHYYFKSKEELLAEAVRVNGEASLRLIKEIFAQSQSVSDLASGLTHILRSMITGDPTFLNLGLECWAVSRESQAIADELRHLYDQARGEFQRGLGDAVERGVIDPGIPLNGLAALLVGVTDGLALQFLLKPELAAEEGTWEAVEAAASVLLRGEECE
jgi:AcrR family transcriptional regulator